MKKIKILIVLGIMCFSLLTGCSAGGNKIDDNLKSTDSITLSDLKNKRIGLETGDYASVIVPKVFPDANIIYYQSTPDMCISLIQGKIDAFSTDSAYLTGMKWEGYNVVCTEERVAVAEYGYAFPKDRNQALKQQFNEFIARCRGNGFLKQLEDKWLGEKEPEFIDIIDDSDLTGENGTLTVGICSAAKPFVYIRKGKLTGFDIEFLTQFARENGYKLDFRDSDFSGVISGVQQKYDIGAAAFTITDERSETIDFSDPYIFADVLMIVDGNIGAENIWVSVKDSFEKTFVREDRWKLILEGISVTLTITVLSVIYGTLLGFILYLLTISKIKPVRLISKGFAKIYSKIISGTPVVVILMILFYVVFRNIDLDGIIVAVIGFTMTFGAFVYNEMRKCIDGLDKGQTEAAYALGYSKNRTFFKILLPQAIINFLPAYTDKSTSLLQATAVVGYIAVNDLTKMSDIIRSSTYEAFFPLISTAVIYFILTWIISELMKLFSFKTDPRKRNKNKILKGVSR